MTHESGLEPPPLPGFVSQPPPDGPIAQAADATISALEDDGLVTVHHRLTCVLIRQLARAVDRGLATPKVSVATSTLARHLIEAIESLPKPVTESDAFAAFMEEIREASG